MVSNVTSSVVELLAEYKSGDKELAATWSAFFWKYRSRLSYLIFEQKKGF
jgi:hypothetical protein